VSALRFTQRECLEIIPASLPGQYFRCRGTVIDRSVVYGVREKHVNRGESLRRDVFRTPIRPAGY
jgi:hypothetical protein